MTAVTFAISFLAFLGMVGLATEVGSWYVIRIQAQGAADAGALAGARAAADANAAWANSPTKGGPCVLVTTCGASMQAAANAAATDTAQRNGYADGHKAGDLSVTVNTPTPSDSYVAGTNASSWLVNEVHIGVGITATYIASLFNVGQLTLNTQAVAYVNTNSLACVLSTGDLTITSNIGLTTGCMLASNAPDETAITISGNPTINLLGMTAVGDCSPIDTCTNLPIFGSGLGQAFKAYQPATINPYAALSVPSPTGYSPVPCSGLPFLVPIAGIPGNTNYPTTGAPWAYNCPGGGITISSALVIPGTYYFIDTPVTFSGGTVQCTPAITAGNPDFHGSCVPGEGVTFMLLGSSVNLTIDSSANFVSSNADVNALPPDDGMKNFGSPDSATSTTNNASGLAAALTGVLFYGPGSGTVTINGGTAAYLNGAIYFPNATVNYGNRTTPSCTVLIAQTINLNQTSQSSFAAGCTDFGTAMPQTQSPRLGG